MQDPLALEAVDAPSDTLTIGATAAERGALLPDVLLRDLSTTPRPEVVRLAGTTVYRNRQLNVQIGSSSVTRTIYAMRTTGGIVLAVCQLTRALHRAVAQDCERIVNSIHLVQAKLLPIVPSAQYARTLQQVLARLNSARTSPERRLALARRAATQSLATRELAEAHAVAASALREAKPGIPERSLNKRLLNAMSAAADGYQTMSLGAKVENRAEYTRGRRVADRAVKVIAEALSRFGVFGYTITG
jgi:hypothetical protein